MDMVSLLVLVRAATIGFLPLSLDFFGYPGGAVTELFSGCLKLRYSTPFSKKFPSWPVVGPGLDSVFIIRNRDPDVERPAKRLRITGKRSALRREQGSGEGLPTPKRWKRLVPQGTGASGDRGIGASFPFSSCRGWLTSSSDT